MPRNISHFGKIGTMALPVFLYSHLAWGQTESILYDFENPDKGYVAGAGTLLLDKSSGSFFGTSWSGGSHFCGNGNHNCGTIFELSQSQGIWNATILHSFGGPGDGSKPSPDLIKGKGGALYGTTPDGGSAGYGVVFGASESNGVWTESVLYSFIGSRDGAYPSGGLVEDSTGALYGTTEEGGAFGYGTVFELFQSARGWKEKVLHNFRGGDRDGANPWSGVIQDSGGTLYGTTLYGGKNNSGAVFSLTKSDMRWTEAILHKFGITADDGATPVGLTINSAGTLFGTTELGGAYNVGTVFELVPSGVDWAESVIHTFGSSGDGAYPYSGVHLERTGALFGTTANGGSVGYGTVFELVQSGDVWTEGILHSFSSTPDGANPSAGVTEDFDTGTLYGTTVEGGIHNCYRYGCGTVFQIVLSGGMKN